LRRKEGIHLRPRGWPAGSCRIQGIGLSEVQETYICDAVRTPIGRFGGSLAFTRADDLAAIAIKALIARLPQVNWDALDEVILGSANQAGEDNRNVARMAALLSGLPSGVPGSTVNRLCASGLDAVGSAARAIKTGELSFVIAGGVESMTRAPLVMGKAEAPFQRSADIHDTTIGWRFINPLMKARYGVDSMPESGENVAADYQISRTDQDMFALRSQQRAAASAAFFAQEIVPVQARDAKGREFLFEADEHPRAETTFEALQKLKTPFRNPGTVTAGNSSGVNDGAAALILASEKAIAAHGLVPRARILGMATAGVDPRVMGIGPIPATNKLLERLKMNIADFDVIELNEAFASQSLAVLRGLGLADDAEHVNPHGGAIALGHPLGATGARLALTVVHALEERGARYGLCTLCVGVGQGVSLAVERVQ
jgi:3-oxoadipyl-CoA thiolase